MMNGSGLREKCVCSAVVFVAEVQSAEKLHIKKGMTG